MDGVVPTVKLQKKSVIQILARMEASAMVLTKAVSA